MTRVYYRYASAAIIVVDITRENTFETAIKWINDLTNKLDLHVPKLLLLNKSDLIEYKIERKFLDQYCKEYDLIGWYLVSAKTRKNLENAISFLISSILDYRKITKSQKLSRSCLGEINTDTDHEQTVNQTNEIFESQTEYHFSREKIMPIRLTKQITETDPKINGKCC